LKDDSVQIAVDLGCVATQRKPSEGLKDPGRLAVVSCAGRLQHRENQLWIESRLILIFRRLGYEIAVPRKPIQGLKAHDEYNKHTELATLQHRETPTRD